MNGTIPLFAPRLACAALLACLLCGGAARAQATTAPGAGEPPAETSEAPVRALELQVRGGVSVATIQVDGAGATGFLPGLGLTLRSGMLLLGALFDGDPGVSPNPDGSGESRSGWHLGATAGATFELTQTTRFDLNAEFGLHQLSDSIAGTASSYATTASLPYFGVRPAVSVQFGSGRYTGAVGAALFFRVDAGQRQPSGLPDDGGHQLGGELFLALRVGLLSGT